MRTWNLQCEELQTEPPTSPDTHLHPFGRFSKGWDNVVLLGDAAGLAEAFFGEGIYYAVRSANIAAECIAATLTGSSVVSSPAR